MRKCLYFICPTDCLETIIEKSFHQENYFFSSLGNSVCFSNNELRLTRNLIQSKKIKEITFVLSDENHIVMDALGDQDYLNITGLNNFYDKVIMQNDRLALSWQTLNPQFLMLSYFLNNKIKELKNGLSDCIAEQLNITGKIYNKVKNSFDDIYTELIFQEDFILN